jgi:acyl carrier protein
VSTEIYEAVKQVLIAELEGADPDLPPEKKLADITNWSSLGFMRVLTALEVRFQLAYEIEELVDIVTIGDLCNFVEHKLKLAKK